jgi:hypothetical protein
VGGYYNLYGGLDQVEFSTCEILKFTFVRFNLFTQIYKFLTRSINST